MKVILRAPAPEAPPQSEAGPDVSSHALREPWDTPTLGRGGFLKTGSIVPWTAPVLLFAEDGNPAGLMSQQLDDEITRELDALGITWSPPPWPGPRSGACEHTWPADYGLSWKCSFPKNHSPDIRCEAQDVKGATLASPTEALHTEAITPARRTARKPAPKQVAS